MILPVVNHGNLRLRGLVDGDDKGNLFAREPFAWVIIPLIVFAAASLLLAIIRHRRRRAWRAALANRQGNVHTRGMNPSRGTEPPASSNARWQWAMTPATTAPPAGQQQQTSAIGRRFGRGAYTREEGLNELGEAPPAYTPGSRNKPRDHEDVELGDMTRPRADEAMPPPMSQTTPAPATTGTEPSPDVAPPTTEPVVAGPPTYEHIQSLQARQPTSTTVQHGTSPIEPPQAVVRYG